MWLWLLTWSCAKELPPHLRIDLAPPPPAEYTLSDLVAHDPLLRRLDPGPEGVWLTSVHGEVLEAWATIARTRDPSSARWNELAARHPNSLAVPLARGGQLAGLEGTLGHPPQERPMLIAEWLGLTRVGVQPATQRPSDHLDWLGGASAEEQLERAIHLGRRAVLRGWLAGPGVPLSDVASALEGPTYTGLAASPLGQIILARAEGKTDLSGTGKRLAWEATDHALSWVSVDGRARRRDVHVKRLEHREAHEQDVVQSTLHRALSALVADARDDNSAGMAIVISEAARLSDSCGDPPCEGVDRVRSIRSAAGWGPEAEALALVWQVIALKRAHDALAASLDKPILHRRLPGVVEALSGVEGLPTPLPLMRHRVASPVLMAGLSSLASGAATTDPDATLAAIRARTLLTCQQALQTTVPTSTQVTIRRLMKQLEGAKTRP